jgi:hypothetical protein
MEWNKKEEEHKWRNHAGTMGRSMNAQTTCLIISSDALRRHLDSRCPAPNVAVAPMTLSIWSERAKRASAIWSIPPPRRLLFGALAASRQPHLGMQDREWGVPEICLRDRHRQGASTREWRDMQKCKMYHVKRIVCLVDEAITTTTCYVLV